jgi:hypothetical protein
VTLPTARVILIWPWLQHSCLVPPVAGLRFPPPPVAETSAPKLLPCPSPPAVASLHKGWRGIPRLRATRADAMTYASPIVTLTTVEP